MPSFLPLLRGSSWRSLALAIGLSLSLAGVAVAQTVGRAGRTVIDTERGGYFTYPWADQWNRYGAEFGRTNYQYSQMPARAIKGLHGRLQHFAAVDDLPNGFAYFPWAEFVAYDADEVAQGRPSMIMTATYQGRKRPLYFSYGAYEPTMPYQGLNVRDERFIKFWIKKYATAVLMQPYLQNWWVGADNCTFRYNLYGVLSDNGTYVKDLPWDAPYPQNDAEWVDANLSMLRKIKEWAPNIRLACNDIGLNDAQAYRHPEFNQYVDGVIREDFWILAGGTSDWYRNAFYESFSRDIQRAAAGQMEILEVPMSATDDVLLRRSWMAFLIIGGDNLFFGPKDRDSREINPALWADLRNRLGRPVSPAQSAQESGRTVGHRLYWRECEGGICYLNWTGATRTVTPPAGRTYYDRAGNVVTSLSVADRGGDCVLFSTGARVSWPAIAPRQSGVVTGPIPITLSIDSGFSTGATIRYTTDGSEPTATSAVYTAPFSLPGSATVKARAFKAGQLESFVQSASYQLTSAPPVAEFHLAGDRGSEFLTRDFALVKLSHASGNTVQVSYAVTGGTATAGQDYTLAAGTLTFPPGEQYRTIPIVIVNDAVGEPHETVTVTLSNPVQAGLGERTSYTYTIDDNDGGANQPPSVAIMAPAHGATVILPAGQPLNASVNDDGRPAPPGLVVTWSRVFGPGVVTFSNPAAVDTTASFPIPGTYLLRCAASDGALSGKAEILLQVQDSFPAWAARRGSGSAEEDRDHDGLSALCEYALSGNPQLADGPLLLTHAAVQGRLALRFDRDPSRTDLTIAVLGADEVIGPWTELATSVAGGLFGVALPGVEVGEVANGERQSVEVRDAFLLIDPARPRRFLQLRVER